MPSLTLSDVPADLLAALERSAQAGGRSVEEEVMEAIRQSVAPAPPRREPGPIFMTEEITAPFHIPHPPGVKVKAKFMGPRQPDVAGLLRDLEAME